MKSYRPLFLLFSEPGLDKIEGIFVGGLARVVREGGIDGYSEGVSKPNLTPLYLFDRSAKRSVLLRNRMMLASRNTLLLAIMLKS